MISSLSIKKTTMQSELFLAEAEKGESSRKLNLKFNLKLSASSKVLSPLELPNCFDLLIFG